MAAGWMKFLSVLINIAFVLANHCGTVDLNTCLNDLYTLASNPEAFWFGNNYKTNCPLEEKGAIGCRVSTNGGSLLTSLFGENGFVGRNNLDRVLSVKYSSPAGSYPGCGNTWWMEKKEFTLDPLNSTAFKPWHMRQEPEITWDHQDDEMFTLVIYHVEMGLTHGMYINIKGGDLTASEVVRPYHGPKTASKFPGVYVYLLFLQENGKITLTNSTKTMLSSKDGLGNLGFANLLTNFRLRGPIALTLARVTADAFSLQYQLDRENVNNCPLLFEQALQEEEVSFLPKRTELKITLNVTFTSPAHSYVSCCKEINKPAGSLNINLLSDNAVDSSDVRTSVTPSINLLKRDVFPAAKVFTGDLYSLVMIDPDASNKEVGTSTKPVVHWMVLNIPGRNLSQGEEIIPYLGPMTPDNHRHTYYFLLYGHNKKINANVTKYFGQNCPNELKGRCLFNMFIFQLDNQLLASGINWFRVDTDDYIRYVFSQSGLEEEYCAGRRGYTTPCPVNKTIKHTQTLTNVLFLALMIMMCR